MSPAVPPQARTVGVTVVAGDRLSLLRHIIRAADSARCSSASSGFLPNVMTITDRARTRCDAAAVI